MMQRAHKESPRHTRFAVDTPAIEKMTVDAVATSNPEGNVVLLVCEDTSSHRTLTGLIGLSYQKYPWCSGTYVIDVVLYVRPHRRGGSTFIRLIDAAEQWAESKKADEIILGISSGFKAKKNIKLYQRLGYKGDIYAAVKSFTI